jgi:hypothetical protein
VHQVVVTILASSKDAYNTNHNLNVRNANTVIFKVYLDYKKVGGLCQYSPNSCTDCCSQFDSNSVCSQCKPGLILNRATNLCEDILIRGCLQKNQIGCLVCSK